MYQGASEAVIAILVAALFGYWIDGYFETSPVFLLIGFAIGFASFTIRLVRLGRWVEGQGSGEDSNPSGGDSDQSHQNRDDRDRDRDIGDESQNENER